MVASKSLENQAKNKFKIKIKRGQTNVSSGF